MEGYSYNNAAAEVPEPSTSPLATSSGVLFVGKLRPIRIQCLVRSVSLTLGGCGSLGR